MTGPERDWGKVCYEAYVNDISETEAVLHDRLRLAWEVLTATEQAHWRAAAREVLDLREA